MPEKSIPEQEVAQIIQLSPEARAALDKLPPLKSVKLEPDPEVAADQKRALEQEQTRIQERNLLEQERVGIKQALSTESAGQNSSLFVEHFLGSQSYSNFDELKRRIKELDESETATIYGLGDKSTKEDTVIVSADIDGKRTLVAVELKLNQTVPPYLSIGEITSVENQ